MQEQKSSAVYNIGFLSNERLLYILTFLNPKSLMSCRAVCSRWREIVDSITMNEILWHRRCETYYSDISQSAYAKSAPHLSWYDLYKSLTLWARLEDAKEVVHYFLVPDFKAGIDISKSFQVLPNGIIGVLKGEAVVYFYMDTLQQIRELTILGIFLMYRENEETIVLINETYRMSIRRKDNRNKVLCSILEVAYFVIFENIIYYTTLSNYLHKCTFANGRYTTTKLARIPYPVLALAYENGTIYTLTNNFTICSYVGKVQRTVPIADSSARGKYQALRRYNFTNQIDWSGSGKTCLTVDLKYEYPILEDLEIIHTHGPIMFAGFKHCILRIYYSVYVSSIIDLLTHVPYKEYYLMPNEDRPKGPILNIDVVEGDDSHTVLVLMFNRMVTIKFTHPSYSEKLPNFE